MSYWIIEHGDRDRPGLFWTGYVSAMKDHTWDRDQSKAVRFCRREDCEQAGLNIERYKPIFVEVTDDEVTSRVTTEAEVKVSPPPSGGFPVA